MKTVANALKIGWKTRRAWWFTATARTRERFARTALGSFWLGLSNLLSIAVLSFVYGTVFKVADFNSYVIYLGTGLVTWNAIAGAVQSAPILFRTNAGNIKNTNTHPIFYSLQEWSFQVQTFLQSFGLVALSLSYFQHDLLLHLLTAGLLPLINLLIFIYWFPLLLCLLGGKYEDLFQLVPIVLQLMFLLTPILYMKETLGSLSWTADINPLYRVLSSLRHAAIKGEVHFQETLAMLLINLLGVYISTWLLQRHKHKLPFLV
jgi:lipopolysaccharide transport system permease protein